MNSTPLIATPSDLIAALGGTNEAASLFECTAGAISQWKDGGIPKARRYEVVQVCRVAKIKIDEAALFAFGRAA